jgi:catechol 2,3-dioxygenase-like lactoylglutathione lyase family enzyme
MRPEMELQGMRHIALRVRDIARSRAFYEGLLGLKVVWMPDPDNVYLTSGQDNLALHASAESTDGPQRLDHFGFLLPTKPSVDAAYEEVRRLGVPIAKPVKDHRDGSRSFYVADPDGNVIQLIYLPGLSA